MEELYLITIIQKEFTLHLVLRLLGGFKIENDSFSLFLINFTKNFTEMNISIHFFFSKDFLENLVIIHRLILIER